VLTNAGTVFGMGDNRKHEMGFGNTPFASESEFPTPIKLS